MVCGIISLLILGIVLGPIAIVLGFNARGQARTLGHPPPGKATAGIVCGIIGLVGWAIWIAFLIAK